MGYNSGITTMGGRAGGGARGGRLGGLYDRAYAVGEKTIGAAYAKQAQSMTTQQLKAYLDRHASEGRLVGKDVITKNVGKVPNSELEGMMDTIVSKALQYNAVKTEYNKRRK